MDFYSFPQFVNEPFWVYFDRLNDFIGYHNLNLWDSCGFAYGGLNEYTRNVIESRFNGDFRALSLDDMWDYYMWFARDLYEREMAIHVTCANPNYEHNLHVSTPSPLNACYNEVHSNVYDNHVYSNDLSNPFMDINALPHDSTVASPVYYCEPLSNPIQPESENRDSFLEELRRLNSEIEIQCTRSQEATNEIIKASKATLERFRKVQEIIENNDSSCVGDGGQLSEPIGNQEWEELITEVEDELEDDDVTVGSMDEGFFEA